MKKDQVIALVAVGNLFKGDEVDLAGLCIGFRD